MRLEKKKRIILIVAILSIAMISTTILYAGIVLFVPLETKNHSSDKIDEGISHSPDIDEEIETIITEGLFESPPIHIDDTASNNWEWAKATGICTGFGTKNQPYLMHNFIIDVNGSGNGILIENSNVYFSIQHCEIYNSGTGGSYAGIKLVNTINGEIANENHCNTNEIAISLVSSYNNSIRGNRAFFNEVGINLENSYHNIISGNRAFFNEVGINLENSNYNTISENDAESNTVGIALDNSHGTIITKNTANRNTAGICLDSSNYNFLMKNTVSGNEFHGILLSVWSSHNTVFKNTATYNWLGIFLTCSDNNNLGINLAICNWIGIVVQYGNDNTLWGNTAIFNSGFQTWLIGGNNNNILEITSPVHIDENGENNWEWAKAAGICTGLGTVSEPYVIQGFIIDGGHLTNGILIENSNVYFRIENCIAYYCYSQGTKYAGIKLYNTTNGEIINNDCFINNYGINLYDSDGNTISGNSVNNNGLFGLNLDFSNYNTISGNTANNNNIFEYLSGGIRLYISNNNNISGNTVNNNYYGIRVTQYSNDNTISENTAKNNGYGITLEWQCNYNTISGNIVSLSNSHSPDWVNPTGYGIYIYGISHDNTISENIVSYSYYGGITLNFQCDNNIISGNTANYNYYGIKLDRYCNNNIISGNNANGNWAGIYLEDHSNGNIVSENNANNNINGIYLYSYCDNNIISGNTAKNTYYYGITLYEWCSDNTGTGNILGNNGAGPYYEGPNCNGNDIGYS